MACRPIPSVANDFTGVLAFFENTGIVPAAPSPELVAAAKRMHFATYSLILWRFRLQGLPEHGQVFIEEIASDALQIMPQALTGYGKTTKLLVRGVIENCLRHVYFKDHPIEFTRMNRESKWYMSVDDLFAYLLTHPSFLTTERKYDAINRLRTLYDHLSAGVHGRRVQNLEMRIALDKIIFSQDVFEEHVGFVERCAEAANFVLAILHFDQARGFQQEDRRIILRTLPTGARRILAGIR
jgi:hypothetical protein